MKYTVVFEWPDGPEPAAEEQHKVVKSPASALRWDVLDREKMTPAARHGGDEMRNERKRMTTPDSYRIRAPRAAPKPHRYKPAIQQAASVAHGLIFSFRQ